MIELDQLFFATNQPPAVVQSDGLPSGYASEFWMPRAGVLRPKGLGLMPFAIWSTVFHYGRLFRNRSYQILLIRKGGQLVHRSCIFPSYFRFPFMAARDLQIGDTWTAPTERGKGLASWALRSALRKLATDRKKIWYICNQGNTASVSVARKAGMAFVGRGVRSRRFGMNLLGKFQIIDWNPSQDP